MSNTPRTQLMMNEECPMGTAEAYIDARDLCCTLERELADLRTAASEALHVLNMPRSNAIDKQADVALAMTWLRRVVREESRPPREAEAIGKIAEAIGKIMDMPRKSDMELIAEQCEEIDCRNGDAPLPPVRSEPLLADDLRLILSVIACACPSSRHKCDCQDRRKAVAVIEAAIAQANTKLTVAQASGRAEACNDLRRDSAAPERKP